MHDSGAQWDEMVPMVAAGAGAINCMEFALGKVDGTSQCQLLSKCSLHSMLYPSRLPKLLSRAQKSLSTLFPSRMEFEVCAECGGTIALPFNCHACIRAALPKVGPSPLVTHAHGICTITTVIGHSNGNRMLFDDSQDGNGQTTQDAGAMHGGSDTCCVHACTGMPL